MNSWDRECPACGSHELQICYCSGKEIEEALKNRAYIEKCFENAETMSLDKLLEKVKGKKNE